jgi:hypothetical protein
MDAVFLHGCVTESPRLFRNLGPYQVAWFLREHGYTAQVIDFSHLLTREQLMNALYKFITPETKVLGWSLMGFVHISGWWYKQVILEILPIIKRKYPNLKIITGGPGVQDTNRLNRSSKIFDYFFYGHSENTMLAFMNHLYKNGPAVPFELNNGNKVIRENFADNLLETEKFNICTCSHRWHDNDCIQPGESLPIEISRGCIFKCKFCRYPYIGKTKNDFTRNMEEIAAELEYNYSKWKITNYYMLEDTFNDRNEKLIEFNKMISKLPFKIGFSAYLRPDLLWAHPGQPELLEEAGLVGGFLGIESFSIEASDLIGKPWSGKHAKNYILELNNKIWKGRVPFKASMIVGIPPDTKEFLRESNQWFIDNNIPDWTWHLLDINRDINGPWVSDFDRNADNYGFTWMIYNGRTVWKTQYMNYVEGRDLKDELNNEAKKYRVVDCWATLERGSIGYDPKIDRYTKVVNIDHKESSERRENFLKNYYSDLMNIS